MSRQILKNSAGIFPAVLVNYEALAVIVAVAILVTTGGGELLRGKGNAAEHLAGIFRTARCIAALFDGNGVIQYGNNNLGVSLQPNDGKLPQSYIKPALLTATGKGIVKQGADAGGNLNHIRITALAYIFDLTAENHRVQHLNYCGGTIGGAAGFSIAFSQTGIAAENVGTAVLAA